MNPIVIDHKTTILPAVNTVVTIADAPNAQPTQPIVKDNSIVSMSEIVPWGEANDFPQQILRLARGNTIIPTALKWQSNLISTQVLPFMVSYDDTGKEILQYVKDNEIYEFLNNRHFRRYQREAANDIFYFLNIFPELILSKNRKKITHIHPNEAAYCRIGQQNKQGVSEFTYISANWPWDTAQASEVHKIRTLDPYEYDLVNWTRDKYTNNFKFIYPSSYPTPGNTFYQLAHWDGIRTSGWLKVLADVPALKRSLIDNQMHIKYHIKIPREHWENEYGAEWAKFPADKRQSIYQSTVRELNDSLIGAKKAGITIATQFGVSSIDGKTSEGWQIEALPDKLKDGQYLADNMEATAHLLYALGIDPALMGFASKEMGSRNGGSDKRESFLLYLAQLEPYRDVLFEPLNFVADFNGWLEKYPTLEFRTKQTILTTLDTGAGKKDIAA